MLSDETHRVLVHQVGRCLTQWAQDRLETIRGMWQRENEVVQAVAERRHNRPEFFVNDEETAREAALTAIWRGWIGATRAEKRDMAHVALARVPVDPQNGWIDLTDIEWQQPFDKYAP